MRKCSIIVTFVMIFTIFVEVFPKSASAYNFAPTFDIYSEAVYMVNLDTGDVVFQKNADVRLVPASLTKIMTCVVVLDTYKDRLDELETTYISGGGAAFNELYLTGCSNADIRPQEKVSYIDLLYALMLPSACEAANILALGIAGSLDGFVVRMNEKAEELGLTNTHFSNAHGLFYEDNYTSARDMATLTQYALTLPLFETIVTSTSYTMEETAYHAERTIYHTNPMLSKNRGGEKYYYEYARGIKTGYTDEAERCLVSMAKKDGYTYLIASLKAPVKDSEGNNTYFNCIDHKNLYEWAFDKLSYTELLSEKEEICEINVGFGKDKDFVILKPKENYSQIWLETIDKSTIQRVVMLDENVIAPIKKGDVLGKIELRFSGETLTTIDLIATSDVERSRIEELIAIAKKFPKSKYMMSAVWISLGVFVLYTVIFVILKISRNKRKSKYSMKKR